MKQVCHMTSAHNSNDVRIFYKECTSLSKAGYDTYLVARGDSREENGVHVIGVGQPSGGRLSRMTAFAKRVYEQALALDADVYHLHDPELLPYALKLKRHGKKVIFDSHENTCAQISNKTYIPSFIRTVFAGLYKQYEGYVTKRLDAVVIPCTFNGANIFMGRSIQTVILPNYPTNAEFFSKYDATRKKENKVCYVGGLTDERGITLIIQAAFKAGVKLILAGSYSSEGYKKQCEAMPEYSCVEYMGYIPNTEIADVIGAAVAGMNTLLNVGQYYSIDTFGVKVYEYMSMGLPVILSDTQYAMNIVNKYHCGICVDPTDTDAIAGAIKYLTDNPDIAREMSQNGRRAVETEFNWEIEEKKLLRLYSGVVVPKERTRK